MTQIDPAALDLIGRTPLVLRALLLGLPDEVLYTPNDEGWSLGDIVAHLHDVEQGALVGRIRSVLDKERPFVRSIDPPARLVAGGYAKVHMTATEPYRIGDGRDWYRRQRQS